MIPDEEQIRARQHSRARMMAIALAAFVILMFGITIVKMSVAQ